jgi:hypothetical protein
MPRPTQGHVIERPWSDGKTLSYGAKVRAYGHYEKVTFGTNKQGWNRTRAELETERIIQQIERETWVPPRLESPEDRLEQAMSALGVRVDESFRVFADRWWRSKQLGLDEDTINDYEWRLGYLERFFGRFRIGEISPQLVDRFRDELHEQAETIRKAQERVRTRYVDEQAIWALMRFADEPAERAPSRQITRGDGRSAEVEKGDFDRAIERLNDAASDADDSGV